MLNVKEQIAFMWRSHMHSIQLRTSIPRMFYYVMERMHAKRTSFREFNGTVCESLDKGIRDE
jgi:hypothetical protein